MKISFRSVFSFFVILSNVGLVSAASHGTNWEALSVVIVLIGGIASWIFMRIKQGKVSKFLTRIDSEYISYKTKPSQCEKELYKLREEVTDNFKKGKIDIASYSILDKRIDSYIIEVRQRIVDDNLEDVPEEVKEEVQKTIGDGEVSSKDYQLVKNVLNKTAGLTAKDKKRIESLVGDWKKKDSGVVKDKNWFLKLMNLVPWSLKGIAIFSIILGVLFFFSFVGSAGNYNSFGTLISLLFMALYFGTGILLFRKKPLGKRLAKYGYWLAFTFAVLMTIGGAGIVGIIIAIFVLTILYNDNLRS